MRLTEAIEIVPLESALIGIAGRPRSLRIEEPADLDRVRVLPRPLCQVDLGDVTVAIAEPLLRAGDVRLTIGAAGLVRGVPRLVVGPRGLLVRQQQIGAGLFRIACRADGERAGDRRAEHKRQHDGRTQGRHRGIPPAPAPGPFRRAHRARGDRFSVQEAAQVAGQRSRGLVSPGRLLLQAFQRDRLQVTRDRRVEPPRRHGIFGDDLEHRVHHRGGLERRAAGDERIQRRPQRIYVRRRADRAAIARGLLGRHVAGRPDDLARAGQPTVALDCFRKPKVGYPRIAFLIEQNVARFQVAVNHATLMGILDRVGDHYHQRGCFAATQRTLIQPL